MFETNLYRFLFLITKKREPFELFPEPQSWIDRGTSGTEAIAQTLGHLSNIRERYEIIVTNISDYEMDTR